MSLVDLIERFHGDEDISGGYLPAVKSLRVWMNGQPPQPSGTDIIRASGVSFLCPREFVLNYWDPRPNKSFDYGAQLKMGIGTFLHSFLQNKILGPMGVLYGSWVRDLDGSLQVREGYHPDPERCIWELQHQVPLSWTFKEESLYDSKMRIRGHIDGRVSKQRMEFLSRNGKLVNEDLNEAIRRCNDIKDDSLSLYEIKSTGTYAFNGITAVEKIPEYYKMQASVYQWLAGSNETIFLYMERDGVKMRGFSYTGEQGRVDDAKRKARIIWTAIRDETLPESSMACASPTEKRARSCVFRKECWSGSSFNFKEWVDECKKKGALAGRRFLDLSDEKYYD